MHKILNSYPYVSKVCLEFISMSLYILVCMSRCRCGGKTQTILMRWQGAPIAASGPNSFGRCQQLSKMLAAPGDVGCSQELSEHEFVARSWSHMVHAPTTGVVTKPSPSREAARVPNLGHEQERFALLGPAEVGTGHVQSVSSLAGYTLLSKTRTGQ